MYFQPFPMSRQLGILPSQARLAALPRTGKLGQDPTLIDVKT